MPSSSPRTTNRPEGFVAPIGCQSCRDQHLKCDRVTPVCGRCASNNKECTRGYKFRVKNGPFSKKQRWIRTPRRLKFVDETGAASGDGDATPVVDAFQDDWPDSISEDSGTAITATTTTTATDGSGGLSGNTNSCPPVLPVGLGRQRSPTDRFLMHDDHLVSPVRALPGFQNLTLAVSDSIPATMPMVIPFEMEAEDPEVRAMRAQIYRDKDIWPLESREEAMLFRHFIQKLSICLDVCDPNQSFETVVPPRAGTCKILMNAILALAAKHLHNTESYDPYASDRYHQVCLNTLIPILNHEHHTMSDENLFAATIILRMWEEMEVKHSGVDAHSYLLGIQAFVHHSVGGDGPLGTRYLMPGSLSGAAFWVGLRQEIYSAMMNQEPVRINLVHSLVDRSLVPTDDYGWANRACVHCADVLNFCFGDGAAVSRGGGLQWWAELDEFNRGWTENLPSSFTPIFLREADKAKGEVFPEVWYQSACHALGVQHHLLAELFLVSFDPKIPRIGGQRKEAAKRTNERIQSLVRKVCGIGLCNQWTPPSMFTACMAIAAFGDQFQDRRDQEACMDLLKRTEKDHARPTEAVQQQMMKSWDWTAG
ncbi:hypothetical protein N8I77_009359 [Diaporthe amygdali]|uniref:Zn(2)-C6 fungal-type domain-containing protein n=1 Tax=Phomopsis amygdali TaxID=1214568 RepID=A0AAD9W2D8_PHOAM|nr:hypothetical protein N8I77_009359 [Diaporthe amygdali]